MKHTVDTLMALAYKLRYAKSASYARVSEEALRTALTEALAKDASLICEGTKAQPIEPTHYLDAMGLCYTAERAKFIGIDVASMVALYAAPRIAQQVREPVAMEDAESLLQDVSAYIGVGGFNGATPKQLSERICVEFERLNNKAQTAQPVREPLQDSLAWELWLNAVDTANNTGRLVAYTYKEAIERAHNIRSEN